MPEELDPTTARLVSELASSILPSLTKSLTSAIPVMDFSGILEENSRTSQELRLQFEKAVKSIAEENKTEKNILIKSIGSMLDEFAELKRSFTARPPIEKALQSGIDDSRAGRSIIVQSIGNVLDEISALKRSLDKMPGNLELAVKNTKSEAAITNNNDEVLHELAVISGKLEDLTNGIKHFCETYAANNETRDYEPHDTPILTNDAQLDKIINFSLPNLEGIVKAESKSHRVELEEFSREISTLHEQSSLALINGVKEAVAQELINHHENISDFNNINEDNRTILKLLRLLIMMSGAGIFLFLIVFVMLIFK